MAREHVDVLITGAGAAGLSLAWHLIQAGITDRRILLVDRAPKSADDRTWCFWERGEGPFESLARHQWGRVIVRGGGEELALELAPYRYKMIRGADFYAHMRVWLQDQPHISQRYGEVHDVTSEGGAAVARVDGSEISADWAFNSIPFGTPPGGPGYHGLLQHFKGRIVRAARPVFDAGTATLMDFDVPQGGDTRFVYVLPLDAQTALVEYTVFSPQLLDPEAYDRALDDYLARQIGLSDLEVLHDEFGVIPMTDAPYPATRGPRVINIGMAGGRTKPSTGYTFLRIQAQARVIAQALAQGRQPRPAAVSRRFGLYDSVLLNVLARGRRPGASVFLELFKRNPPARVFAFLDETTSLLDDLRLMSSTHLPTFLAATFDVLARRIRH